MMHSKFHWLGMAAMGLAFAGLAQSQDQSPVAGPMPLAGSAMPVAASATAAAGAASGTSEALLPLTVLAPKSNAVAAPVELGCRALTDKAMGTDLSAVTAQSAKAELAEQARLFELAVSLWSQAVQQCEGRAKERAVRNLDDDKKILSRLAEKLDSGPQCALAHKDARVLQDIARQSLSERRWAEAAAYFRKSENMWDLAVERCSGTQKDAATQFRDQSELDGHNAEFCAPQFELAREHTQKLRSNAATLSREEKQNLSQTAETLWRDALGQCKGAAVRDMVSNNIKTLGRERGTPWVATMVPAANQSATVRASSNTAAAVNTAAVTTAAVNTAAGVRPPAVPVPGSTQLTSVAKNTLPAAGGTAPLATSLGAAASVGTEAPSARPSTPGNQISGSTRFTGSFVRDGEASTFSGVGRVQWANGDVFDGNLVKGKRHGKGSMTWDSGMSYDGDWVNDYPTGVGKVLLPNGDQYQGAVIKGIPQGQGRMVYQSGDIYEGTFNDGLPDGKGVYAWKNGQQYDGEWKDTRPNGVGKLKFTNGNLYQGTVIDGVPTGQGRMDFATGGVYTGQLKRGEPDGEGSFVWPSGEQYQGQWRAGKKHGKGVFTWKSGERWEGIYDNDQQTSADNKTPKS